MRSRLRLLLMLPLAVAGCTVEPYDAAGKTCRADSLCPAPLTCVFPPADEDGQAGGADDAGASIQRPVGPREGRCELLPCARVVCPGDELCVKDGCYPKDCSQTPCGVNEVCESGRCVARGCVGVSCEPQSGCALSSCYPHECASQTCGADELCIEEACTDARCVGVECPNGQSCVRGFCYQERCGNTPCGEDELCVANGCRQRACIGVVCPTGKQCVGGSCQTCPEGLVELNGACIAPKPSGASCQTGGECDAGSCVDGRCCESQSCGPCQRCNVLWSEGRCTGIDAGAVDATCQGYVCSAGGACATSCVSDLDCAPDRYCASTQCALRKTKGATCDAPNECASGHCVSGRCCDGACSGPCQSCVEPGLEGTCTALAADTAISACAPYRCAADGGCRSSCANDAGCVTGACVGSACTGLKGLGASCDAGTQCQSSQCVDGVCCNGGCTGSCEQCNLAGAQLGTCSAVPAGSSGAPSCSPLVCSGASGACPTTCTSDSQCAASYYCSGGACLAKKSVGGGCTAANQCLSGFCPGGTCCGTSCAGVCETCSSTPGTCTAKAAGTACTQSALSGQCVGGECTVTRTVKADLDAWVSTVAGNNYGNGLGDRLVVGKTDYVTPSGAGMNRSFIRFPLGTLLSGVPNSTSITKVALKLRVRGPYEGPTSCWGIGGSVKFLVEELTGTFTENSKADDCSATTSGTADSRWPGPSATATNRGRYSGTPAQGDIISVDLTAMLRAAKAAGKTELRLRLIASNSTDGYDELTEARKVAFNSRHTTAGPTLEMTFTP